jgi:hypothetical protein
VFLSGRGNNKKPKLLKPLGEQKKSALKEKKR